MKKIRLGDLLVNEKLISNDQLQEALHSQTQTGKKLGRSLIDMGFVQEDVLLGLLAKQLNVPFIDLTGYHFNAPFTNKLPELYARRFRAILLHEESDGRYLVGMADPTNIFDFDELSKILDRPLALAVVRESELLESLDLLYRRTAEIIDLAGQLSDELGDTNLDDVFLSTTDTEDAPVVKLLQTIFEDAIQVRASDIHIEPDEKVLRIRQRIDGILQEQVMNEREIASALILRLKLMAGLNISEKRLPQDGRFSITVNNRSIDVRVSTLPAQHGESVVMRILDQTQGVVGLKHIGMPMDVLKRFQNQIRRPHGLILVTGPTGSGKTTTLYSALNELNQSANKIITAEDPVEYSLPRVTQVQVNEKIGFDFASVLRSALRQDPDILLVGEIRDRETADIAIRASLTGHLVLSTLHTNDATSSAMRLLDIGVEGYLVASSLRAVIAQRLVRRICHNCKAVYEPDDQERVWLSSHSSKSSIFYHGKGCTKCNNTGYQGRIGVFELLEIDHALADALRSSDPLLFNQTVQQQSSFRSLKDCALEYAQEGITTLEEVFRVSEQIEDSPLSLDSGELG